ncbi:MAG TPA: cytochrome b [Xanthobacteraceae bacterium]|nr:cytochrome b [Xanthobacteraceae bacterium]
MADLEAGAKYTLTARILHWIIAAIVITMIPLGIAMANAAPGPGQDFMFKLHLSLGVTLLPLVLLRIIWRLTHTAPTLPSDIPAIQRAAASLTHFLLYVALVVQPILGWIGTSAYRAPVGFFGLFELPPIWREDRGFSDQIFMVHKNIGILMAALILAHIGGALFHHFIRRDDVLRRMM